VTALLLACVEPQYIDPPEPVRDSAEVSSEGWDQGGAQACSNPVEPAWTDESDRFGAYDDIPGLEASLALAEIGGAWQIAVTTGTGVAIWPLQGGDYSLSDTDLFPVRALVVGLTEQRTDLLLTGEDTVWRTDWQGTTEADTTLALSNRGAAEVVDLDGDGARELVLAASGTGEILGYDLDGEARIQEMDHSGAPFDLVAMDLDQDGDPDLYVCNDFGPENGGNLWLENDGAGTLAIGEANGSEITTYCMGASFGDLDGDGALDVYLTAIEEQFALLGSSVGFIDATASMGFPALEADQMGWGAHITDLDNDGHVDLLVANSDFSVSDAELFPMWWLDSEAGWADRGGEIGLPREGRSRAVIARDLNGDGLQDILASEFSGNPLLYMSAGCTADSWLRFKAPVGSVVRVEAGDRVWTGVVTGSPGSLVTAPSQWHVGLGELAQVDRISLRAPWQDEAVLVGPIEVNQEISWSPP